MRIILTTLMLFSIFLQPAMALEAIFQSHAQVKAKIVRLGDVVSFSEKDPRVSALTSQRIAQSPSLGKSLVLNQQTILRQLASQGILPPDIRWSGAQEIEIRRQGVTIPPEKISQIIDAYLVGKAKKMPDIALSFSPNSLPLPFLLPPGKLSWEIIPSRAEILGSSRFSIIFKIDGKVQKNLSIRGKLKAIAPVLVAREALRRDTELSPNNFSIIRRDISNISDPLFSARQAEGQRLRRRIRKDDVIRASSLEHVPVVHRGDRVKIHLLSGNLQVVTLGVARADGGVHDFIRVQNINSKKIIYCQVVAPGIVKVKL
ncbi:flagellar basal body P-ring formation chaperone FlgA [Desulfotalea psychrophila]|uniref:Related to flagellar protein (FlgA) n=1 Tax=Desulfotalea psychrophila (strain LSv54 / DSM 12343) TaxID=177439 RepID=Q6AJR9_DESPS|nr:flagellar basal body P-ring formation chaperone FlgA [Desulfotalea psychrophila]CAG37411.1 related to flagellar protein (FlgA) [Desulfotalea psychrophila LSv54]